VGNYSEAFIGVDTAKLRNAVAVAEAGRRGETALRVCSQNCRAAYAFP
jgi:hypothetical protein